MRVQAPTADGGTTMKRLIGVAMLAGTLAVAVFASGAHAQCGSGLLIKFDADCFAYETNYNPATFISSSGSQLNVVGIVSVFCAPLDVFNPNDANKEYTFLFTGLTSAGTVGPTPLVGGSTRWQTNYGSGQFFIYEGSPRNAPTAAGGMPPSPPNADVPSKFTDGTLILSGTLSDFVTTITQFSTGTFSTSFRANYQFTGGTQFALVSGYGMGLMNGAWCAQGTAGGLCDLPTGYSSHPNGKFDIPTTPVEQSTWGRVKQLYR
jgi:hypothetical protein